MTKNKTQLTKSNLGNEWASLREYTDARIALGRAGNSLPTHQMLAFQMDHANAQDAVHIPLDIDALNNEISKLHSVISLKSRAKDRAQYLQRPDYGKRLNQQSVKLLQQTSGQQRYSVCIVIVDGLSSFAVQRHAAPMTNILLQAFINNGEHVAPICIVQQGRVAIGDEIATLLQVKSVVLLVGERPGLSSPDSLGLYYTFAPKIGLLDANRNCISNIRDAGLSYTEAANKLMWLLEGSRKLNQSGVNLKDETTLPIEQQTKPKLNNKFLFPIQNK